MDRFKVRVWEKSLNRFLNENDDFLLSADGNLWWVEKTEKVVTHDTDSYVIQQFTGLKDKNGMEIYEGDIVKSSWEENNHEKQLRKIFEESCFEYFNGEVKFVVGQWCVCENKAGRSPLYDFSCCHEHPTSVEVIGNIFQNPELLEKK